VAGRQGRRRKQLVDDVKKTRDCQKLKEEELARTVWRIRFGRICRSVARQITK
jgi:hypothetical protein